MYANKSVADAPLQGKVDGARMASRGGCPLSAISLERLLAVTVRREIDALTLEELDCVLASDAHHHRTPSRNYGEMDPLSTVGVQMVRCSARCDPVLGTVVQDSVLANGQAADEDSRRLLSVVRCDVCGRAGGPSAREWRAVVNWNYERASEGLAKIEDVNFFNLVGLTDVEAMRKVRAIRLDLWLRIAQGRCAIQAGRKVGGKYIAKLEAYLGWVNVAILALSPHASGTPSHGPLDTGAS